MNEAQRTNTSNGSGLHFDFEWVPAEVVTTNELAATWAALSVWVDDECITRSEDPRTGSSRRAIYVSLYPLSEWIAYNWWFLTSHSRPIMTADSLWTFEQARRPWETMRPWWLSHHNLHGAGEGFPWPDLTLIPDSPYMHARWFADSSLNSVERLRMLSDGKAWLPHEGTLLSLRHLVDLVVDRLDSYALKGTPLHEEWNAIQQTSKDEAEFCEASARLGSDPYEQSIDTRTMEALIEASDRLNRSMLDELANAAEPDLLRDSVNWVDDGLDELRRHESIGFISDLQPLASRHPTERPWVVGYEQARALRAQVSTDDLDRFEPDRYILAMERESPDRSLLAITMGHSEGGSVMVRGRTQLTSESSRFLDARGLWHSLFSGDQQSLVTDADTYMQRVGRAFAAELLAPAYGIEQMLPKDRPTVSFDAVQEVAGQYGVSPLLVEHQVKNQLGRRVAVD